MLKSLLIPVFVFGIVKLVLTLVIAFQSLNAFVITLFVLLIFVNFYILIFLISGRWLGLDTLKGSVYK